MTSQDQAELTQSLITTNTIAARLWMEEAANLASQGHEQARAVVDMGNTEQGQRALWELTTHIDLAIAACAFDLPAADEESREALLAVVAAHPQTRWVIDQHQEDLPLDEVNEALSGARLEHAKARLDAWLAP